MHALVWHALVWLAARAAVQVLFAHAFIRRHMENTYRIGGARTVRFPPQCIKHTCGCQRMCMRSKAWLAASVSLRLARLPSLQAGCGARVAYAPHLRLRQAFSRMLLFDVIWRRPTMLAVHTSSDFPRKASNTRVCARVRHSVAIYGQYLLLCDQSMREKAWRSRKRGALGAKNWPNRKCGTYASLPKRNAGALVEDMLARKIAYKHTHARR
jgi:hypothetical protein